MIEFEVKERKVKPFGQEEEKTVYYAAPKMNKRRTTRDLENYIINATSLARGDVRNALTSLAEFVNISIQNGDAVELADLGMIKIAVGAKQMDNPREVNVTTLKTPKLQFFPKKEMREAANRVRLKVVNPYAGTESETESGAIEE